MQHRSADRASFRDFIESLPLSAFPVGGGEEFPSFVQRLFGTAASTERMLHCADLGVWETGWTVVAPLPEQAGGGWFGLVVGGKNDDDELTWEAMSRGTRINVLTRALRGDLVLAQDLPGLAYTIAETVTSDADGYDHLFTGYGPVNFDDDMWLARHILRKQSEGGQFLTAFTTSPKVERAVLAIDNIWINRSETRLAERCVAAAARKVYGVDLNPAQVERTGIGAALMIHPQETWAAEAERLVALAHSHGQLPQNQPAPRHRARGNSSTFEWANMA